MRKVLIEAIQAGGYMESPFTHDDKLTGGSNDLCVVYDGEGNVCPRCGDTIVKGEINGKKMFYSPGCQHDR
ncbi:Formamidopyrimidine-DNA glycosylase [compost metagenome]